MGEQIKAVVQVREGVTADDALRASIMEHLSGRLAKFKWPRTIDFMDELPREPTGKLLKRKLRDPYWADRRDRDLTAATGRPDRESEGSSVTAPLVEHHVLEYPGGYTRSIGPALSRYFGGLRDGKIVGVRLDRRPGDGAARPSTTR